MRFNPRVFDVWVFRRSHDEVNYLLLHTSAVKADRHFAGGRFWQVPSDAFRDGEGVTEAVDRVLAPFGLEAPGIWAAEHVYTIYNRRFDEVQTICVFAAEVSSAADVVALVPEEHDACAWLPFEQALERVHYRGLKDGLRSTHEYVSGVPNPAPELRLR
jgi:lipoyl(octanoyl) transferase